MGLAPFKFTNSHNFVNTNSIPSALGLNDGEICHLYGNSSALFLYKELTKSHSILDLSHRVSGVRPRPTTPNLTLLY